MAANGYHLRIGANAALRRLLEDGLIVQEGEVPVAPVQPLQEPGRLAAVIKDHVTIAPMVEEVAVERPVPKKPPQRVSAQRKTGKQLNVDVGMGPVFKEKHYTITELMAMWAPLCRNTIRKMVIFEPGVVKISGGTGKRDTYLVPESVVLRIHTRLSS